MTVFPGAMIRTFNIGDRVVMTDDCNDPPSPLNPPGIGTIMGFEGSRFAVEFDDLTEGHDCSITKANGKYVPLCKYGRGWWVNPNFLLPSSPLWDACSKYIRKELQP